MYDNHPLRDKMILHTGRNEHIYNACVPSQTQDHYQVMLQRKHVHAVSSCMVDSGADCVEKYRDTGYSCTQHSSNCRLSLYHSECKWQCLSKHHTLAVKFLDTG